MESLHNMKYLVKHQELERQELERQEGDIEPFLEIKESKIKGTGNGLYTTKFIPKNSLVTYYSPTYIISGDNKIYTDNKIITDKVIIMDILKTYGEYSIKYYNTKIIGLPGYRSNKYLGHLINDKGYKPGKIYKPHLNNCTFNCKKGLAILSTRDIKKGEELYVTYGKNYWYSNVMFQGRTRNEMIKEQLQKRK